MEFRKVLTRTFLWILVLGWGPLLGAKLFDLVVLVGAWSASPPESLRLLPYGDDFPVDTGEFFIPGSAAVLAASIGALVSSWRAPLSYRLTLAVSGFMLFASLFITVAVFWPLNSALWASASGQEGAIADPDKVRDMVRTWVAFDWVRVAIALCGFVAALLAFRTPYPAETQSPSPAANIAFAAGVIVMIGFTVYFVTSGL